MNFAPNTPNAQAAGLGLLFGDQTESAKVTQLKPYRAGLNESQSNYLQCVTMKDFDWLSANTFGGPNFVVARAAANGTRYVIFGIETYSLLMTLGQSMTRASGPRNNSTCCSITGKQNGRLSQPTLSRNIGQHDSRNALHPGCYETRRSYRSTPCPITTVDCV